MNPNWKQVKLGEICSFKYGQMPDKADLTSEGYPVFSGYRIVGFSSRYHYEDPEIIVVARGEGGTGDVKLSPPFCFLTNLSIAALVESSAVHKRFLYYRLASTKLWNLRTGSAQAQITIGHLKNYEVLLPPPPTQQRVADILSAYDDLIDNNTKRIKILDEMVRSLYREWFVNFRFPGHEKTKLVKSPLGEVPEGWRVQLVEDTFEIVGGGTPSKENPEFWEDGNITWYTPSDLTAARTMFVETSSSSITRSGLARSSAHLFPARSVMMTSRATIGVVAINTTEACTNQGFITCIPSPDFPIFLLFQWLRENKSVFEGLGTGSTFKEITKGVFRKIKLVVPPNEISQRYEGVVGSFADRILNLQRCTRLLRATRDLLLPRLISGEIDVSSLPLEAKAS